MTTSSARLAGSFMLAGGVVFALFNTIAEGLYPSYNLRMALSDLGALGAPTALLWDVMLFATGLFTLLGIMFLFFKSSFLDIHSRNLTGALFMLAPIGIIIVSLFPENYIGVIHLSGAFTFFTFGGILDIYAYRFTTAPFRYFSVLLGVISFGATPLLGVSQLPSSLISFGVAERLVVYPLVLWYVSFAGYLMSR